MALTISWTPEAEESFEQITDYILGKFGETALRKFLKKVQLFLDGISEYPNLFPQSKSRMVRKGLLSKQTTVYYRVKGDTIELLSFFPNASDPEKMIY